MRTLAKVRSKTNEDPEVLIISSSCAFLEVNDGAVKILGNEIPKAIVIKLVDT